MLVTTLQMCLKKPLWMDASTIQVTRIIIGKKKILIIGKKLSKICVPIKFTKPNKADNPPEVKSQADKHNDNT